MPTGFMTLRKLSNSARLGPSLNELVLDKLPSGPLGCDSDWVLPVPVLPFMDAGLEPEEAGSEVDELVDFHDKDVANVDSVGILARSSQTRFHFQALCRLLHPRRPPSQSPWV